MCLDACCRCCCFFFATVLLSRHEECKETQNPEHTKRPLGLCLLAYIASGAISCNPAAN